MEGVTVENLITILGALSIGAILTNWFQLWLDTKKSKRINKEEFKEKRYKAIIILMHSFLDFEKSKSELEKIGRKFESKDELEYELLTEWRNMLLFANDKVLKSMKKFISNPNEENYWLTGIEMRKDLYGIKTKLNVKDLITKKNTSANKVQNVHAP